MSKLEAFKRFTEKWARWFNWLAMASVAGLLLLTVADILGSKLRMPIPGGYYITGFVLLLASAFGVAQAEVRGRHIRIDIFLLQLPEHVKGAFGIFSNTVSAVIIGIAVVTSAQYGYYLQNFGLVTMDLAIPLFPFAYVISVGFIPLFLVLVYEVFDSIRKARNK